MVSYSMRQRGLTWLIVIHLIAMMLAWLVAGKQTTPTFSLIRDGSPLGVHHSTGLIETPWPVWTLVALCVFQLMVYAGRGLAKLGRHFGSMFFRLENVTHWIAAALLVSLVAGLWVVWIWVFGGWIVRGLNYRMDKSTPQKVTTTVIERIPGASGSRLPVSLKLKDWRSSLLPHHVWVTGYPSVFEINGNVATFYVREGAFGMPYAIERSYVGQRPGNN